MHAMSKDWPSKCAQRSLSLQACACAQLPEQVQLRDVDVKSQGDHIGHRRIRMHLLQKASPASVASACGGGQDAAAYQVGERIVSDGVHNWCVHIAAQLRCCCLLGWHLCLAGGLIQRSVSTCMHRQHAAGHMCACASHVTEL